MSVIIPRHQIDATMGKLNEQMRVAFQARLDEVGAPCPEGYEFPTSQHAVAAYDCFRAVKTDITLGKAASFARTVITRKRVSDEVRQEREAICLKCDQVRFKDGEAHCAICTCSVSGNKITNRAAWSETAERPGCKHPARASGRGWPLPSPESAG